jgi:hypothetical protein
VDARDAEAEVAKAYAGKAGLLDQRLEGTLVGEAADRFDR